MTGSAFCGPHCGIKDGREGHCPFCHARVTHGNARRDVKHRIWETTGLATQQPVSTK